MSRLNSAPLVSVVTVTSGREHFLPQTIEGVLRQTCRDFEYIIVNNASCDNTEKIVHSYSDSRIKYFELDKRLFGPDAYNHAVNLASGKFVAIQHDDDISLSQRLEKQLAIMQTRRNTSLVGCWYKNFGESSCIMKTPHDEYLRTYLMATAPFPHAVLMFNKSLFDSGNLTHDTNYPYAFDYKLLLDAAIHTDLAAVQEPLIRYRVHAGQESKNYDIRIEAEKVRRIHWEKTGIQLTDEEWETLLCYFLGHRKLREDLTECRYEKISRLIDKIVYYNKEENLFPHDHLLKVMAGMWRKCCIHASTSLFNIYSIYKAQKSLKSHLDGFFNFYLYPFKWKMGARVYLA